MPIADSIIETVRSAAVQRRCLLLAYNGTERLVEPYSLRFTPDGNILLYARRIEGDQRRTYRLDRIQSATLTDIPFVPLYNIEMTGGGPLLVRPPH